MDRRPFIGLACGRLDQYDRPHVTVLGVDLPMSDGDGLSHVLSAHQEVADGTGIADALPEAPIDAAL
jgi:hypothetical protein